MWFLNGAKYFTGDYGPTGRAGSRKKHIGASMGNNKSMNEYNSLNSLTDI